jgi:hypothetical protein
MPENEHDTGLRNVVNVLADLADELLKEDGPRIKIIVDQKVCLRPSSSFFTSQLI